MKPLRVVIAGGGTGGHLYPGISVARELRRRYPDAIVTFAGTSRGIESRVVPREGFELDLLRSAGVKAVSPAALARAISLLPLSAIDAWSILSRRTPDVVLGVGGYSSGPVMLLAALRRMPTLLLEQNAAPGLTNKILAPVVSAAAVTFASTASYFGRRAFVAGNPVRPEFFENTTAEAQSGPPRILIFGGSQGAHAINMAMVEAAPRLAAHPGGLAITHQTGERDLERVREGYRRARLEARVEPFLYTMDREMKTADVVICRAGATTLAELTAAGTSRGAGAVADGGRRPPTQERRRGGGSGCGGSAGAITDDRRSPGGSDHRARIGSGAAHGDVGRGAAFGEAGCRTSDRRSRRRALESALMLGRTQRIHFVGIGGIGMSGIAELLANLGTRSADPMRNDRV